MYNNVECLSTSCEFECKLLCSTCQICPHMYSCTCLDFTLHSTVCKHIHLIHMSNALSTSNSQMETAITSPYNYSQVLCHGPQTSNRLKNTKTAINTSLLQLQTLVRQCDQVESLHIAKTHVQAGISVIKALHIPNTRNILPIKRKIAANANNIKQPSFFSTKKKRKTTNTLKKPTHNQVLKL